MTTFFSQSAMVPIDDDRLVRNGARVAIHIQDRWRSVSQWREGDALARLAGN